MKDSISSKIALVSGATSGIGEIVAREIARMGAKVVILGRDREKCEDSVAWIRSKTGNRNVNYIVGDLTSVAQTRMVVDRFKEDFDKLDILVNNVGAIYWDYGKTSEGVEKTFALNHLCGYFLLTKLCLDLLENGYQSRVVNVTSDSYKDEELDFNDLGMKKHYKGMNQYLRTKLMNVLFTQELAARLEESKVSVNCVNPGPANTNLGMYNHSKWWYKGMRKISSPFLSSRNVAAKYVTYLAVSPDVKEYNGAYFDRQRRAYISEYASTDSHQKRLWMMSEKLIETIEKELEREEKK